MRRAHDTMVYCRRRQPVQSTDVPPTMSLYKSISSTRPATCKLYRHQLLDLPLRSTHPTHDCRCKLWHKTCSNVADNHSHAAPFASRPTVHQSVLCRLCQKCHADVSLLAKPCNIYCKPRKQFCTCCACLGSLRPAFALHLPRPLSG